mmetsp:Transcript_15887/g.37541  ORF Transcript_15887/g.37541 Transcript_15887/m.37541 type:complete len:296 (+) Transcript_15887:122-1009(+)
MSVSKRCVCAECLQGLRLLLGAGRLPGSSEYPPKDQAGQAGPPKMTDGDKESWDWPSGSETSLPVIQALPKITRGVMGRSAHSFCESVVPGGASSRSGVTPTSISSTEASNLAFSKDSSELGDAEHEPLCIPAHASLLEGVRQLLLHHLERGLGQTPTFTPGQAQLFDRHLHQLASHADKLAQAVLNNPACAHSGAGYTREHVCDASGRDVPDSSTDMRRLKLKDKEVLEIYFMARQEAHREADWRGVTEDPEARVRRQRHEWLQELRGRGDFVSGESNGVKPPRAPPQPPEEVG